MTRRPIQRDHSIDSDLELFARLSLSIAQRKTFIENELATLSGEEAELEAVRGRIKAQARHGQPVASEPATASADEPASVPPRKPLAPTDQKIIDLAVRLGGKIQAGDLKRHLGMQGGSANARLSVLCKDGFLERSSFGVYQLVQQPEEIQAVTT